jgi:hypothetical protein
MNRNVFQAVRLEYSKQPTLKISVDGNPITNMTDFLLPNHDTFRGRRITLPESTNGFIPHLEVIDPDPSDPNILPQSLLQNEQFEGAPIESFSQQQLFHYYEVGIRGGASGTLRIYLDGSPQTQQVTYTPQQDTDTIRVYFDALSYGYIPHIHNIGSSAADFEILWARPVALPPRFYRGVRTHSEFQITYKGDVDIQWFLDGESIGTYNFNSQTTIDNQSVFVTETKKDYFQSGTIGHVLQYKHTNPEEGGKVYMIETDITLGDLEQQAMSPQVEG